MKYNIGDRVKGEYGLGTVIGYRDESNQGQNYLVQYDNWNEGHSGRPEWYTLTRGNFPPAYSKNCWYHREKEMELVKSGEFYQVF